MMHPSYSGRVNRGIKVKACPGINRRPYPKNNYSKKCWRHGSGENA
jgi:hypothetical protein